jgi:hypothetical protein
LAPFSYKVVIYVMERTDGLQSSVAKGFLFSTVPRPSLRTFQISMHPFSNAVRNEWSYAATSSYFSNEWCLIKDKKKICLIYWDINCGEYCHDVSEYPSCLIKRKLRGIYSVMTVFVARGNAIV